MHNFDRVLKIKGINACIWQNFGGGGGGRGGLLYLMSDRFRENL